MACEVAGLPIRRERPWPQPQCNPVRLSGGWWVWWHGRGQPGSLAAVDCIGAAFRLGLVLSNDLLSMFHAFASSSNSETEAQGDPFPNRDSGHSLAPPRGPLAVAHRPQSMSLGLAAGHENQGGRPPRLHILCGVGPRLPGNPFPAAWIAIWKISCRQCWHVWKWKRKCG